MKSRTTYRLVLAFITLVLVACRNTSTEYTSRIPTDMVTVSGCPEATPGSYQLIATVQGICFLYPEAFNAVQGEDGTITLYVRSMFNNHVPIGSIRYTPAGDLSLEEIAAQRMLDYAWPETQPESIIFGGEAAVMLDNLPGQDTNRRVVVVHEDRVYDLVINGVGANYGAAGELAEVLYDTIVASIQFIEIEPNAPMFAGPECPFAGPNMEYTNEPFGYCLLLPAGYTALMLDSEGAEMAFFVDNMQDKTHPRLFITVTDGGGRSLEEVTMDREAEIEMEVPGSDAMWSWASLLDGEPSNEFRQVPGPELSREVVTLHREFLYTLTFFPDSPTANENDADTQNLYEMVMDSFSFLWDG